MNANAKTPSIACPFDTEIANAERFVARHGSALRFCHVWSTWLAWDGKRWARDASGEAKRRAKATVRELHEEAATFLEAGDHSAYQRMVSWAKRSCSNRGVDATLSLAQSALAVDPKDLDAHPMLLCCDNGTVDLRTGQLRPHRREDMLTHLVPHHFDPSARCDRFELFLGQVTNDRADLVDFLQRWLGYCITGEITEHAMLMLVGTGANGKSLLVETVRHVIGDDLAISCPPSLLLASKGERHPTEIRRLFGRRLVIASEVPKGAAFSEERVKSLTGGDTLSARGMREDFTDFKPTHKLVLCANDMPRVRDSSDGFWRRLRVVPFEVSFVGREDRTLPATLHAESAGILAWLVRGCTEWQAHGLGAPVSVLEATSAYREAEDHAARFIASREWPDRITSKDLRAAYAAWCEEEGERALSPKDLGREIGRHGWTAYRTKQERGWETVRGDTR